MPNIKINTWKAISNSKIELMEYEKVSTLANIEDQKELFKMKNVNLMIFIYANLEEIKKDKKETLKLMMSDIVSTEIAIQEEIEGIMNE